MCVERDCVERECVERECVERDCVERDCVERERVCVESVRVQLGIVRLIARGEDASLQLAAKLTKATPCHGMLC